MIKTRKWFETHRSELIKLQKKCTISEEILTMFLIPMQSREQRDKWWRFLFLLKNDDIDSPALHTYEAADEKLWSSEIHNKQMLHHKSWHCWIIITISNIPTWKEKIGMKPLELWNAAEFQTDGFENCPKRYHTYRCEQIEPELGIGIVLCFTFNICKKIKNHASLAFLNLLALLTLFALLALLIISDFINK